MTSSQRRSSRHREARRTDAASPRIALDELEERLAVFAAAQVGPDAVVSDVAPMGGHAGFAYGFTVTDADAESRWFLRLPPPGARWRGTADMVRQVTALEALEGSAVPHCSVRWWGGPDDLEWFDSPYYIVEQLQGGTVIGMGGSGWVHDLSAEQRSEMGQQAVEALAAIHGVDWASRCGYLGDPVPLADEVTQWDRLVDRAADPALLADAPRLRDVLLDRAPDDVPVGLCHGDFQFGNLYYSTDGQLRAVLDWELTSIGSTLCDIGWFATFCDPAAWNHEGAYPKAMPDAEELVDGYRQAVGESLPDIGWFRALAAYKFAIIAGFNLGLHRRGKRSDSHWEQIGRSIPSLQERAAQLLAA